MYLQKYGGLPYNENAGELFYPEDGRMSWIIWTVIGILGANVIFFGGLLIAHIIAERKKKDE